MALIGVNGGLIGARRSTNVGAASGMWTANEQTFLRRAGFWFSDLDAAPGTSPYAASVSGSGDEVHVVVIDEDGLWTGTAGSVLAKSLNASVIISCSPS